MAGTGKRADQKKTLILNLDEEYFRKDKALRRPAKPKLEIINLRDIEARFESLIHEKTIKETTKGSYEANFKGYKILAEGELKHKLKINASSASESAIDKVKKAGGDIILSKQSPSKKKEE